MMYIIGIDDAGRGPLIGSMFLAGVLIPQEHESEFKAEGVNDSKQLTQKERERLAGIVKDQSIKYEILESTAEEIDHSINTGTNLNTLEAIKAAKIINTLVANQPRPIKIVIDCPSVNTAAWQQTLEHYIKDKEGLEISCEHKADANHPSVAAGSILAKCERESSIAKLKSEFGDFGSGYPSDPTTKQYLKDKGEELADSGIFRKTWQTWKKMYPENNQSTLF